MPVGSCFILGHNAHWVTDREPLPRGEQQAPAGTGQPTPGLDRAGVLGIQQSPGSGLTAPAGTDESSVWKWATSAGLLPAM